jgi:prepilin-type processing-associated H-X9-DG protein
MSKNSSGTDNGVGKRTIRAATESMTVVPIGRGTYEVYSGTRGCYRVSLLGETCTCPDVEHNAPAGACKHFRRVQMEVGERPIPDLPGRTDVETMIGARNRRANVAMADGGAVLPAGTRVESGEEPVAHADGCTNPECEGFDAPGRPLLSFECWGEWSQ